MHFIILQLNLTKAIKIINIDSILDSFAAIQSCLAHPTHRIAWRRVTARSSDAT